jgi:DNA adenine methylase
MSNRKTLTVAELRAKAKALHVPRYSRMRKAELIEAIAAHEEYDPADNSEKCYTVAIGALRERHLQVRQSPAACQPSPGPLLSPFPYFGGKRSVAAEVWQRLGAPAQYIEPFCGSAALLLAAPRPAQLEVINDGSGFIANFWRAVKHQPAAVAQWADYPVSHIDLGARHRWLMAQRAKIGRKLHDPDWPGDAKVAGWWLWGQCCWIGSGWCDWFGKIPHASDAGMGVQAIGQIPHASRAGMGVQAIGQIPHASRAGMGVQAIGQIPHASRAGMGVQAIGQIPHASSAGRGVYLTSCGETAHRWLHRLAARLERVRIVHGEWSRCLNNHFGGDDTAVFLDPPYRSYERLYGAAEPVADAVAEWARKNEHLRIALCGHKGDYDLPGWTAVEWSRGRLTYSGKKTTDQECVWYSPACIKPEMTPDLFSSLVAA